MDSLGALVCAIVRNLDFRLTSLFVTKALNYDPVT